MPRAERDRFHPHQTRPKSFYQGKYTNYALNGALQILIYVTDLKDNSSGSNVLGCMRTP